jgi:hypothetical protein
VHDTGITNSREQDTYHAEESLKPMRILNRKPIHRDESEQFLCSHVQNRGSSDSPHPAHDHRHLTNRSRKRDGPLRYTLNSLA